jgi:uncharacterized ferritin-like protein (DUF455 family)
LTLHDASHPINTLGQAALDVLDTANALEKAQKSQNYAKQWRQGLLAPVFASVPPSRPARPLKPELLAPGKMPKRRKAGALGTRIALLHALAHIELNAIDLAWDMLARFGPQAQNKGLPIEAFISDWVQVGDDEARHFQMLDNRLQQLGSAYGDLPAHDGLWDAAHSTRDDFLARLAVVPMVLEARGLDVTPATVVRLQQSGDDDSAALLETIYTDEIMHVKIGSRWFHHLCTLESLCPESYFHHAVRTYFRGKLKPPFNDSARLLAGMLPNLYQPLAL